MSPETVVPGPRSGSRSPAADTRILHVAPDPQGGWLVEAEDHSIATSCYETLDVAREEAQAYARTHGWVVVVHDHSQPAAGSPARES